MTIKIVSIVENIASLSIPGITNIKKLDEIPQGINPRDLPALIPDPNAPVTDFVPERKSLGLGTEAAWDATYTLNYLLVYKQVGTGRVITIEAVAELFDLGASFVDTLLSTNVIQGATRFTPKFGEIGILTLGGISYHVLPVSLDVLEIVQ